jgi:hypothetical protein
MMPGAQRDDREAARARLVELQNELHDRRTRVADLTRSVNVRPPTPKERKEPRIPHSKIRVQIAAICGLLAGYGISQIGGERNGRAFGMATTIFIFVVVNWFVPWPLRFEKKFPDAPLLKKHTEEVALEDERRACERLEREIHDVQGVLGSRVEGESAT